MKLMNKVTLNLQNKLLTIKRIFYVVLLLCLFLLIVSLGLYLIGNDESSVLLFLISIFTIPFIWGALLGVNYLINIIDINKNKFIRTTAKAFRIGSFSAIVSLIIVFLLFFINSINDVILLIEMLLFGISCFFCCFGLIIMILIKTAFYPIIFEKENISFMENWNFMINSKIE